VGDGSQKRKRGPTRNRASEPENPRKREILRHQVRPGMTKKESERKKELETNATTATKKVIESLTARHAKEAKTEEVKRMAGENDIDKKEGNHRGFVAA